MCVCVFCVRSIVDVVARGAHLCESVCDLYNLIHSRGRNKHPVFFSLLFWSCFHSFVLTRVSSSSFASSSFHCCCFVGSS